MTEEDDFLSRWSRRKRAGEEPPRPGPDPGPAGGPGEVPDQVRDTEGAQEDEAVILERLGLPVPESLKPGDDFTGFMADGVPEFLRRRALRVLWRSNPVLANLDGLNDYDDDFNSAELTQKVIATGYQVGRGFIREIVEKDVDNSEPVESAEESSEVEPDEPDSEISALGEETPLQPEVEPEKEAPIKPRRMRFET